MGARRDEWLPRSLGVALLAMTTLAGCPDPDLAGLRCPILAPGALTELELGQSMSPFGSVGLRDDASGELRDGAVAAHALHVPAGALVRLEAQSSTSRLVLSLYGPRDPQGGFPGCSDLMLAASEGASGATSVDTRDDAGGEYLLLVALQPGLAETAPYTLTARCLEGCDAVPCPTLAERGCGDVRCDGALTPDASGCLTCTCDGAALCPPGRAPGPWGTCVLPGCTCEAGDDDSEVCGVDGRTWPSSCDARCHGVAPARDGACDAVCPSLATCSTPCFGRRLVDPADGCPTCTCASAEPADPIDCAGCPLEGPPVCGADGVTYTSRCAARCAGARVLYAATCDASCTEPPEGCGLVCPWGLVPSAAEQGCLSCACAGPPSANCLVRGAPLCVAFDGFEAPVTVGSPCLAVHLDPGLEPADVAYGPCGTPCGPDAPCPDGSVCAAHGVLAGRCLAESTPPCGCSSLLEPVCGADGQTRLNRCLAACEGVAVAHEGACCEAATGSCDDGEAVPVDTRGCPDLSADCGAAPTSTGVCIEDGPNEPVCAPDGTVLDGTACEAHVSGSAASAAWCAL